MTIHQAGGRRRTVTIHQAGGRRSTDQAFDAHAAATAPMLAQATQRLDTLRTQQQQDARHDARTIALALVGTLTVLVGALTGAI